MPEKLSAVCFAKGLPCTGRLHSLQRNLTRATQPGRICLCIFFCRQRLVCMDLYLTAKGCVLCALRHLKVLVIVGSDAIFHHLKVQRFLLPAPSW